MQQKNFQIPYDRVKPNKDPLGSYFHCVSLENLPTKGKISISINNNNNNNYIKMVGQCKLNFQITVKLKHDDLRV